MDGVTKRTLNELYYKINWLLLEDKLEQPESLLEAVKALHSELEKELSIKLTDDLRLLGEHNSNDTFTNPFGRKCIRQPRDLEGNMVNEGDMLTTDNFDPSHDYFKFCRKHYPEMTDEEIDKRRHEPCYTVRRDKYGMWYGEGKTRANKDRLYLHDYRIEFTKKIRK